MEVCGVAFTHSGCLGSYPVKWVNTTPSCLKLLPAGTAAAMTFTAYTTWLMKNALKTARRVPIWLMPGFSMVLAKDPGAMKWRVGRKSERAGIPEGRNRRLNTIKDLEAWL